MMRRLQMKWNDEAQWRDIRLLGRNENADIAIFSLLREECSWAKRWDIPPFTIRVA